MSARSDSLRHRHRRQEQLLCFGIASLRRPDDRERRHGEDLAARVLGHGVARARRVRAARLRRSCPTRPASSRARPGSRARARDRPALAVMRRASRKSFSERLRSPLARASQPSFSKDAASTGSMPSSSAVSRTSSIMVCAASSSPFTFKKPAYASVALMRARTLPLSPASSRARVSRISASSSSSRTMCADASAWAAIVCRSFRPASRAFTYARSMNRT